jgi:hypothetical protein
MREEFLQLTVLSSEVVKASMQEQAQISVSCSASELPKYNFTLLLQRKQQDLGHIGNIVFDKKRPLVLALANLNPTTFDEFFDLVRFSPPRNPSIYLKINDIEALVDMSERSDTDLQKINIYDIGWRFPLT